MKYSMRIDRSAAALLKREDGSFTLEASMVFPALFFALIALLMLSMYTYQKVVLYYSASLASERTAFRWDNSARDPISGIGPTGRYDGLYWRMADNGALRTLFDFMDKEDGDDGKGIRMAIGTSGSEEGAQVGETNSLPELKMRAEAGRVSRPFAGAMHYGGTLIKRIEVKLYQPISIAPLEMLLGHSKPETAGSATIVDPVELIRNVDLARYYTGKFKGGMSGGERKQAQQILNGRKALDP